MISDFKKKKQQESKEVLKVLQELLANSQSNLGIHTKTRLKNALALVNKLEIENEILLSPVVHAEHHQMMEQGFLRHWESQKKLGSQFGLTAKQVAEQHFRFFTLINSIELVEEISCFEEVQAFKENLTKHIEQVSGISCLGAIEVEVVSIKQMRRYKEVNPGDENAHRKLDVCEKLRLQRGFDETDSPNMSFLLVHFHGILSAKKPSDFDKLKKLLRTCPQWAIGPRQIEIKKLSSEFNNKKKSMEENLSHIAAYITKGGNDWVNKGAYLRYKIGFESTMNLSLEEWEALNWRKDASLQLENKQDGLVDMLSLTSHEISTLASLIHSMMVSNPNGTGYQIKIGTW